MTNNELVEALKVAVEYIDEMIGNDESETRDYLASILKQYG